jgi:hypothetical protein
MGTCSRCADPTTGCCESTKAELLPDGMASQPEGGAGRGVLLALKTLKYCRGHASGATIVPPAPLDALPPPRGNRCFSKLSFHPPFPGPLSGFKKKAGSRIREPRARRQSGGRGGGGRRHGVGFSRGQMRARRPFAAVTAASRACPCLCPRAGDLGLSLPATLWLPAMFACPCAAYNFFQSHPTHRPTAWSSPCSTDVSPVPQPFVLATCSTAGARASPGCDSLCARLRASERASALGPALSLSAQGWASGWVRWAEAWRQCNAAHSVRMDMTLC